MSYTPQIADIVRCDWISGITGGRGTKYYLVIDKIPNTNEWEVWSYHRNRKEKRDLTDYSNEVCTARYTKVA